MSNSSKIINFLNKHSLSQYIPLFERQSIEYEDLSYIKEHHIMSYIGISSLHDHIRLMNEINKLQSQKNQSSNKEVVVVFNGDTYKFKSFITKNTSLRDIFNEVKAALCIKSTVNDYVFRRGLDLFSYSYSLFYDEDCLFTNGRYEFELVNITQFQKEILEDKEEKANQSYNNESKESKENKENIETHIKTSIINNTKSSLNQKTNITELNSKEKEDFSFYTLGINKRKEDYLKTSRSNKNSNKPQKTNKKKRKNEEDSNEINENNNAFDSQTTKNYSPSLKSSKSLNGKENNQKVRMINLTEESYMLYFNNRKKGYFDKLNNYYIEAKKIRPTRKGDESSSKEGDGQMKDLLQSNSIDDYEYLNLNTDSKLKAYVNESRKNKNLYMTKKKSEKKRLYSSFLMDEKDGK